MEQRKIAVKPAIYDELKEFSDWSGIPMATVLTRLWLRSEARQNFLEKTKNKKEEK